MKKNNPEIIDNYLNYLISVKNYSQKTVESYNFDLILFVTFIKEYRGFKEINKFSLLQVGEDDVYAFLVYCNYYRENNPYTRQRKLVSIRGFYNWILDSFKNESIINPTDNIKAVKKIFRLPRYLSLEQAKKIQNVFNEKNSLDPVRNNTIITFLLSSGLRVSELVNIQIKDIDFKENQVKIFGKGGKERTAYFSNYAKEKILEYIKKRHVGYLFEGRNGKLSREEVLYICKRAYKLIGLNGKFTTHTLRHTSATLMYMYVKQDTLLLKEFLGHTSIVSTQIYTHILNSEVKEAVNKNPLASYTRGEKLCLKK